MCYGEIGLIKCPHQIRHEIFTKKYVLVMLSPMSNHVFSDLKPSGSESKIKTMSINDC